jgi:predicted Zn-dependent protease with MMP-like domain
MTIEDFEKLAGKAVRRLPREFRERLDNVVIAVEAAPTRAQTRRFGRGLLGLYEGVPLSERGSFYSGAMPDKITLFMDNIAAGRGSEAELLGAIRHTLMHEIAHHFGMDDDELIEKGLY